MYSITGKIMFKNGQGDIVDENGNEAMDWEELFDPLWSILKKKEKGDSVLTPSGA
jgi:hypothetical protein